MKTSTNSGHIHAINALFALAFLFVSVSSQGAVVVFDRQGNEFQRRLLGPDCQPNFDLSYRKHDLSDSHRWAPLVFVHFGFRRHS
jgi:hypothetical protein